MLGFGAIALDAQGTNVAPPAIHHDLGGGFIGLQWIVTGYTLVFSALGRSQSPRPACCTAANRPPGHRCSWRPDRRPYLPNSSLI